MPTSIIRYRKVSDIYTTYQLQLPDLQDQADAPHCTELCTLGDRFTYVAIPAGVTLPEQPKQIIDSIEMLTYPLPDALREQIKAASPHIELINERVRAAISERYSLADEIKLLRTAPSPEMQAYDAYAEECRSWGRAEKAKLGL